MKRRVCNEMAISSPFIAKILWATGDRRFHIQKKPSPGVSSCVIDSCVRIQKVRLHPKRLVHGSTAKELWEMRWYVETVVEADGKGASRLSIKKCHQRSVVIAVFMEVKQTMWADTDKRSEFGNLSWPYRETAAFFRPLIHLADTIDTCIHLW